MTSPTWKRCSMCDKELGFTEKYYACSVSTCNRKRTGLYFCSVDCWEAHLPMMRHRDAWAEEQRAPTQAEWARALEAERDEEEEDAPAPATRPSAPAPRVPFPAPRAPAAPPVVRVVATPAAPSASDPERRRRIVDVSEEDPAPIVLNEDDLPRDVLVVVSKLKQYVRARSGMNTSDGVVDVLSDHLRALCTEAIRNAARDGRKTVMDRDFKALLRR